ncbi:MAG: aromatic ring-hydroxylating dioxygenase subunit alpha [Acidimicrobiia bacterium]|nr:aromatic ring-hydroxylating dioxygenase subunit alpha [Acidimicrobiia bacterium]MDH5238068.1 aromatic ring-hydroxylating dioxygenase subunit alpha [Acidimicrobiia bacterium]
MSPSPGITYQQLLDGDTHPVPDVLRIERPADLGDDDVPVERYVSHDWHQREVERLWRRVWQFACREEHLPEVGDHIVYEIVRDSYLVIRTAPDEIKAYPNACLHRGRQLKDHEGRCSEIRCPFHGFAWRLDGTLQDIPAEWDFGHVKAEEFSLPEVQVDTWAGFVFINPDPGAEPLADFLGELVDHYEIWNLADRYVEAHVAKVIPANWKVTQEAFCEAYHVNATHPQIMPWVGDTNTQVDVWRNFSRAITPSGTPSPLIDFVPSQDDMMRAMLDVRHDQQSPLPQVTEQQSMRAMAAAGMRERLRPVVGDEQADRISDAELMDNLDYTVFPNFHPWGGFNRIVYRFRPNGDDQRSSIMECLLLAPFAGERPPPAPVHWLEEHETFTDAHELGGLAKVFDQDLFNMPKVQSGLEATRKAGVTLASYQEAKIRWLHTRLGEWVEGE